MRDSRAIGHHFGAGLARVVGEVWMKQSSLSTSSSFTPWPRCSPALSRISAFFAPRKERKNPVDLRRVSLLFELRNRIIEQRRARAVACNSSAQVHRTDQNAGIDVAIQRQHAHRAAVPAAGVLFQIFDGLRGGFFGRADDGYRPHVRQERIQRIVSRLQHALHVIHGVEHAA